MICSDNNKMCKKNVKAGTFSPNNEKLSKYFFCHGVSNNTLILETLIMMSTISLCIALKYYHTAQTNTLIIL